MGEKSLNSRFCRGCLGKKQQQIGAKNGYLLLRCDDCGTVVVDPYPTRDELTALYQGSEASARYMDKKDSKMRRCLKRATRLFREGRPGRSFLDVGCNVGFMTEAARRTGFQSYGIDIDVSAIEIARANFPDAEFDIVDVESLALRGRRFDVVYMSEVVEHLSDPESFVASVSRVMTPDALLYITAPDAGHFRVPRDFAKWDMVVPPHHLTYFTRDGLRQLLGRHSIAIKGFQMALKPGIKAFARKIG